jgi:hypothetical protein
MTKPKPEKTWFSAKGIFIHADRENGPRQLYEERVVLLRARSSRKAWKQAEREADRYAKALNQVSFAGIVDVFRPFDKPGVRAEVYSKMEQSDLTAKEYLRLRYPREPLDCEADGREHRYYNKGRGYSACYHCAVVKPGELWK